jgi:hypothetical protein
MLVSDVFRRYYTCQTVPQAESYSIKSAYLESQKQRETNMEFVGMRRELVCTLFKVV